MKKYPPILLTPHFLQCLKNHFFITTNSQSLLVTIVILSIIASNRVTVITLYNQCGYYRVYTKYTTIVFVLTIINYHNIFCSPLYSQGLPWHMAGA